MIGEGDVKEFDVGLFETFADNQLSCLVWWTFFRRRVGVLEAVALQAKSLALKANSMAFVYIIWNSDYVLDFLLTFAQFSTLYIILLAALTNAVNLRTKVPRPTYLSVVVFFPSVRPKHLQTTSEPSPWPWSRLMWPWLILCLWRIHCYCKHAQFPVSSVCSIDEHGIALARNY